MLPFSVLTSNQWPVYLKIYPLVLLGSFAPNSSMALVPIIYIFMSPFNLLSATILDKGTGLSHVCQKPLGLATGPQFHIWELLHDQIILEDKTLSITLMMNILTSNSLNNL